MSDELNCGNFYLDFYKNLKQSLLVKTVFNAICGQSE